MEYLYQYNFQSDGLDQSYFENLFHPGDGTKVLCVSESNFPLRWVTWKRAANYASQHMVKWVIGDEMIEVNSPAKQYLVPTIVAIRGTHNINRSWKSIPLTNPNLFRRDEYLCLYCGGKFKHAQLTRDHIKPQCLGGKTTWTNLASACVSCNLKKDNAPTPEAAGMKLIATPYEPNLVESLILSNRRILVNQMEFLQSKLNTGSRLKQ